MVEERGASRALDERNPMPIELLQLREVPLPRSVVMVRLGSTTLDDERMAESCEDTLEKWGFFGFSVLELPPGGFDELARLSPILRGRRRVLIADSAKLLRDRFPLFPTGPYPHWTVVLSDSTQEQFSRVRSHFSEQDNPSYERRER